MNRTLKRPMFRIGGSAGTGITSGLDQPQKMANGGRTGYQQGTVPNFQFSGMPGFLTSFGLDLLSRPPQGGFFQTVAASAKGPFETFQAAEMARAQKQSERDFARELAEKEREFESGQLEKRLEVEREKIAKMGGGDRMKRIESAKANYGGNEIKASREIDFYDNKFTELQGTYGDEGVFIDPVDLSVYESQRNGLEKFVKQNPQLARQVVYDVRTGKAIRFVKDQTGKFAIVPADSADIDTTGEGMPAPESQTPRSFDYLSPGQKKVLEDIQAGADKEFGMGFYD